MFLCLTVVDDDILRIQLREVPRCREEKKRKEEHPLFSLLFLLSQPSAFPPSPPHFLISRKSSLLQSVISDYFFQKNFQIFPHFGLFAGFLLRSCLPVDDLDPALAVSTAMSAMIIGSNPAAAIVGISRPARATVPECMIPETVAVLAMLAPALAVTVAVRSVTVAALAMTAGALHLRRSISRLRFNRPLLQSSLLSKAFLLRIGELFGNSGFSFMP